MNILVCSDDGPGAIGMVMLGMAVKQRFREANVVTMTTSKPMMGQGMAVAPIADVDKLEVEQVSPHNYVVTAKPIDLIYLAFYYPERFVNHGTFDLVLTGINHGANVGADLFHSGTVGMALLATYSFGVGSVAFSLHSPDLFPNGTREEEVIFAAAKKLTDQFFTANTILPEECYNVNFPVGEPRGVRTCQVSRFSRFRPPPSVEIGRFTHQEESDRTMLPQGYVTVSLLELRVNESLGY